MFRDFSTQWKKVFHTVEKFPPIFPHCGKMESTKSGDLGAQGFEVGA
jgi:hypothetical protein